MMDAYVKKLLRSNHFCAECGQPVTGKTAILSTDDKLVCKPICAKLRERSQEPVVTVENLPYKKTGELIKWYNKHSAKPVKRFADRETAEVRCKAILESTEVVKEICKPAASPETRQLLSAAVAETWKDPKVAAKRTARHAVEVDDVMYPSVGAAFRELGLPMSKVISFRMRLKESGERMKQFGMYWQIKEKI